MGNPAFTDLVVAHLQLRTLAAIDQKMLIFVRHHLRRWMTVVHRQGGIIT